MQNETATLGGGCFWCLEAIYQRIRGVITVEPGYSGGIIQDPSYQEVSGGQTGHAEVVQVTFDPNIISYNQILEIFWHMHDPTQLNQQGSDVGPQYRSVIFYHNAHQKQIAEQSKLDFLRSGTYSNPILTEIVPLEQFFKAEAYHQNYYNQNRQQGYCRIVIDPKIQKLTNNYRPQLK